MKSFFKEWKKTSIYLLLILTFGFIIRYINLTYLPVFADEAIYVRWSQVMASEPTLRFLPLSDGKQPAFMWILMFIIKYFNDPLFVGRLLSVVMGLSTTFGIFVFSCLLFKNKQSLENSKQSLANEDIGKHLGLFASAIYTVSTFTFFFDRMALVDSMLASLVIWTSVFAYLTFKNTRLDFALITGILLGLATLTKSPAIFLALSIPFFVIFGNNSFKGLSNLKKLVVPLGLLVSIYFVAFAMYNVQRLGPNFDMLTARTKDYAYPVTHLFTNPIDPLIPHLKDYLSWLVILGPFPILVFLSLGLVNGFKSYKKELFILILLAFVPVYVQSAIGKVFTARYVLFTIPFLFIISSLSILTKNKLLKIVNYVFIFLFLTLSLNNNYYLLTNPEKANLPIGERAGYLEEWTAGQGIKEISEYIKNEFKKDETKEIVVGTEGYFGTLPDGLQMYLNDLPNNKVKVVGIGLGVDKIPESLSKSVEFGTKTYLVINKSRYLGNSEGLKLIASYKKADRNPISDNYKNMGPYDELLFFEVLK